MIGWLVATALAVPQPDSGRTLGDHVFPQPRAVDAPFTATFVGFDQGLGLLVVPDAEVPTLPFPLTLRLLGAVEALEVQARITGRTAAFARAAGQVVTGIDADTAYARGAVGGGTVDVGGRTEVRFPRSQTALGVRGFARVERGVQLEPSSLVESFLDDREDALDRVLRGDALEVVLRSQRATRGGIGLSVAQRLPRPWGLQASATLIAGREKALAWSAEDGRRRRSVDGSVTTTFGAALDYRPASVPVGGLVEVHNRLEADGLWSADVDDALRDRTLVGLQVLYTGRPDLQFGLGMTVLAPTSGTSEQLYSLEGRFVYFFGP